MTLSHIIESQRLIVCVGPGGVGKTTVAAAIALEAARRGRRALVLTIDPARRLASALGLRGLDDSVVEVPAHGARGELWAAMLETRASYDALMHRIGKSEDATRRILENRVYQSFSRTLARSHAYVAMERLYDVVHGGWDLVVLDTPPMRSALDILDAPARLAGFLDDDIVRWFVRPPVSGALSRLLPLGGAAAMRLLALLASRRLVDELIEFFRVLLELRQGFRDRAEQVTKILRQPSTAFALVCAPSRTSLDDAAYLRDGLAQRGVPLAAVIFNLAFVSGTFSTAPLRDVAVLPPKQRLEALESDLDEVVSRNAVLLLLDDLARLRAATLTRNASGDRLAREFSQKLPEGCLSLQLPELERDVRDIPGLIEMGRALTSA
jgi:anion-transporting  ArsA/GET3 family ATPase